MKPVLLLSFLILRLPCFAQELVANGSFEEKNICTEYTRDCAPEAWLSTWLNSLYYFQSDKHGFDGAYFCGVIVGSTNARLRELHSFLYTRLLCGLRKGNRYRCSFSAWSPRAVFDSLGVYFSSGDFLYEKRTYRQLPPAFVVSDSSGTLASPDAWHTFTFEYTATGAETDMVIGSFKHKAFQLTGKSDANDVNGLCFLYIDKISLQPLDPHELLCKSADSMKTVIYNVNERHEMLDRRRKYYANAPPVIKMPVTIEQHIDTLLIPDILFATGSAKLIPGSLAVLDSFCRVLAARPSDSLVINGHTDSVGTLPYNLRLSADRANAVGQYIRLQNRGRLPRIYVRYHAFLHPVASNKTPEGRTRNRRVELFLYRQD